VAGIDEPADRSIVDAVIALAHGLGIGVVAEGIETERQAERLRELGCDFGQGYLFSRPVPLPEARTLLRASRRRTRAWSAPVGAARTWPDRPGLTG
jgi:EAL domain-containing protein (putative c-di-GMP-specific phosphodiesterase class I)